MAEIRATRALDQEYGVVSTLRIVLAHALFASTLEPSDSPAPDQIRRDVVTMFRRLGTVGCEAQVADEFGNHPDTAPARMRWALARIDTVFLAQSETSTPGLPPLALAS